jgi:hypothetical protein
MYLVAQRKAIDVPAEHPDDVAVEYPLSNLVMLGSEKSAPRHLSDNLLSAVAGLGLPARRS